MSTARDEAERIANECRVDLFVPSSPDKIAKATGELRAIVADLVEAALAAAERRGMERAAKVADEYTRVHNAERYTGRPIATAIRALAGEEGT